METVIASTATKTVLPKAIEKLYDIGFSIYGKREIKKNAEDYLNRLKEECSSMKILGMERPVPLDEIYTEVRIVKHVQSRFFSSVKEVEKEIRDNLTKESQKKITKQVKRELERKEKARNKRKALSSLQKKYPTEIIKAKSKKQLPAESKYLFFEYHERKNELYHNTSIEILTSDQVKNISKELPIEIDRAISKMAKEQFNKTLFGIDQDVETNSGVSLGIKAIGGYNKVAILGKPGAGKTTFLKHIVLRELADDVGALPFLISLREYNSGSYKSLLDYIAWQLTGDSNQLSKDFSKSVIKKTKEIVFLFDGLDEIPSFDTKKVVEQISVLSKHNPGHKYVVTCRTANYNYKVPGFSEVEICDFNSAQVAVFVKGWFKESSVLAVSFLKELKRNAGLRELTTTPLLLALICIGYKRKLNFSNQKALIYLACLDALLIEWDSSRQIQRDSFVDNIDSETKKHILSKMACDAYCDGEYAFSSNNIVEKLSHAANESNAEINSGEMFLKEFELNHGLLVQRAFKIYSFSHLTIQEFLTSFFINININNAVLDNLSAELLKDLRWREVVVFLCGLMANPDKMFVSLRNTAKSYLAINHLDKFLIKIKFVEENTKNEAYDPWGFLRKWRLFESHVNNSMQNFGLAETTQNTLTLSIKSLFVALEIPESRVYSKNGLILKSVNNDLNEYASKDHYLPEIESEYQIEVLSCYINYISVIVDAISSGARISHGLKLRLVADILSPNMDEWEINDRKTNRLGI